MAWDREFGSVVYRMSDNHLGTRLASPTGRQPKRTTFHLPRTLGWLGLGLLLLSLGCRGQDDAALRAKQNQGSGAGDVKKIEVAFVTNQIANFWNYAKAGCEDAAAELSNDQRQVIVRIRFPNPPTADRQKQEVEDLMAAGIQGLAISPLSAEDQVSLLNQWAAKIPLITHDSDAPDSDRLVYIGMDNYLAGRMVGEMIKEALPDGGKVALFVGRLEQDNAKHRRQGVIDVLMDVESLGESFSPVEGELKNERFEIVGTYLDQGETDVALRKAEDALSAYHDLAAMVGLFEYNPPEIIKAVEKRNKLGQVVIVGFDENFETLEGIKEGHVVGTVVQDPYGYGYQSVKTLTELLDGDRDSVLENRYIDFPPRLIKPDNLDEFWDVLRSLRDR